MKIFAEPDDDMAIDFDYVQIVVMQGINEDPDNVRRTMQFFEKELQLKHPLRWIGLIVTGPGCGGAGGRQDAMFVMHGEDVMKLAVNMKMRTAFSLLWVEDAYDNGGSKVWPDWFVNKYYKECRANGKSQF